MPENGTPAPTVQLAGPDEAGVAVLSFDTGRPANSMTRAAVDALGAAVHEVSRIDGVRVLVIRGRDEVFSGGADLGMLAGISEPDYVGYIDAEFALFDAVEALPFVTVASVAGACLGNAAELALACDLRIAGDDARFGLPETRIGFQGPMGRAIRYVGLGVAKYLLFTGEVLSAAGARELGLVTWDVPAVDLATETARRAAELAALPPVALLETKRNLAAAFPAVAQWTDAEKRSSLTTFRTADAREGRQAFLDRRAPVFRGR
ncbi:hypothetical protein GIS00_18710 [Nakamurella sp. YIM 132087]|uniref:Enoyl-CoA hydratase/isomerase family protein n=1 Tax=Nakamurella alba TaxID=2665158 RepID=A0A7K1FPA3_9ACTN|nr:enoyl-CoA hydratase-related protein [Nakamurella alba]MTD15971.1 hypothetical protein [Nakamurella alba]